VNLDAMNSYKPAALFEDVPIEKNNICKWLEKDAITVYEKGKWPLLS
jgi:hypothetical protein